MLTCYATALRLEPTHAEAQNKWGEAIASCRQALATNPERRSFIIFSATLFMSRGAWEEALTSLRQALCINPGLAMVHYHVGLALQAAGQLDEAIVSYRQAVVVNPNHADALFNLGSIYFERGQPDEAETAYRQGLQKDPRRAEAHVALGNILRDQGRAGEAVNCYRNACELEPAKLAWRSCHLFNLLYDPEYDQAALFEEHQRYAELVQALAPAEPSYTNEPTPERPPARWLRFAGISQSCARAHIWPLLRHHDHERFAIFLYSHTPRADLVTGQFRNCADQWHDVGTWSDEQVAEQVRQDGIDILVDVTMHTAGNRLGIFARKPAPVQVTFAAYPGGTGLPAIDYRLTDPYLDPPGPGERWFAETTYRLPHSFWCYYAPSDEPAVGPLPALRNGYVTFGFLGNFCKVNARVLDLWARVLAAIPDSRLVLLATPGSHRQKTGEHLARHGISPLRVEFRPRVGRADYLALYHQLDMVLDTFPYNGHTTGLDALWMGVPVITLFGASPVSRGGLSQLTNLGLADLAANNADDFVRAAKCLAADLAVLADLRRSLRERMRGSILMDAGAFACDIEGAYRTMWHAWCTKRQEINHANP